MTTLRFFRGIAVPASSADQTIASIRENGLIEGQGTWNMLQSWGLPDDRLGRKADLSTSDTRRESATRPALCACGTVEGAAYYAWHHNRTSYNDTPVLVEFDAPLDDIAVDGRDFLYPAFQCDESERAMSAVDSLFGKKALAYAETAWASNDQCYRVALCDLATMDPQVVLAHYANCNVIGGRYGTVFENAFTVALPVLPGAIIRVWSSTSPAPLRTPSITVVNLLDACR